MNVLETIESNSFCNGSLQCCVIGNEIVSVTNSRYLPNHALYHDRVTTTTTNLGQLERFVNKAMIGTYMSHKPLPFF